MAGKIEKFKKSLSIILIAFLMLYNTVLPTVAFADEVLPEETPTVTETPTPEPTITQENNAVLEGDIQTVSNTGDNTINPTPTPTPFEDTNLAPTEEVITEPTDEVSAQEPTLQSQEETQLPDTESTDNSEVTPLGNTNDQDSISASLINNGSIDNNINSDSNTGENTIATISASRVPLVDENDNSCVVEEPLGKREIESGAAVSETIIDNTVNTNSVNSQVIYQTINIFIDESGNLNLSDPFEVASSMIQEHPNDETINVSFTNLSNYAYVSNNVVSLANSGGNTINGTASNTEAIIKTGDAYSIVSLLNKVNFTVVNSVIHVVSINVFGKLNGNIILPDLTTSSCVDCGMSLVAENNAKIVNNVNSVANSGQNTINGNGSIDTKDAASIVNNLNLVNANYVNTSVYGLFINLIGNWLGDFIGWNGFTALSGGSDLMFFSLGGLMPEGSNGCLSCVGDLSIKNSAYVENNVNSVANSGGNTINGNGEIKSGNAFSTVSLVNFVNANFINSVGFFGFINIFGDWKGDIGGKSQFDALNNQSENEQNSETENNTNNGEVNTKQEEGGLLSVEQVNNVGQYVYPGDTVTFFVKVKNPGVGKVYGTKLKLFLIKDGVSMGGGIFEIGDIPAGKTAKLSTGLVLSTDAAAGEYIAVALAEGNVGPDSHGVSGQDESSFNIFGKTIVAGLSTNTLPPSVLGTKSFDKVVAAGQTREMTYFALLIMVIVAYSIIRTYRKRQYVAKLFLSKVSLKDKLKTLKMFLF